MAAPWIAENLALVRAEIAQAALASGRKPADIELVAVSKTHSAELVEAAIVAGHSLFGENRVQEAAAKFPALRSAHPSLRLHLIGPLQTNKVRDAAALFDVIETLDRPKLADALVAERERSGRCPALFVQVNTGEEPQKAGIPPREADAFIEDCRRKALPVEGLMCIPPADEEPSPHFALLREIARRHGLVRLSMGMSGDFPVAVRFGATEVRVGTAIFGVRSPVSVPA